MKDRGKAVEVTGGNWFSDYSSSDLPCRKHPSSSSSGICAYCLKDRLIKLVCSDCGEQRLSSCSCSDISSYRNSCTVEVGSVGRVSFLIENEKAELLRTNSKPVCDDKSESVFQLKRSSSSSIDVKKTGLWKFRKFFRKKKEKGLEISEKNTGVTEDKGEMWIFNYMGMSRSRSVSGFRTSVDEPAGIGGVPVFGNGDMVSESREKNDSSEVKPTSDGRRSFKLSGLSETLEGAGFIDVKRDCHGVSVETESGLKGVKKGGCVEFGNSFRAINSRSSCPVASEADFSTLDDSGFIDLKLGSSSELKPEQLSGLKMGGFSVSEHGFSSARPGDFSKHGCRSFRYSSGDELWSNGDSCRITVNEKEIKKSSKSLKVWRWVFKHH
ncbi:uncharacterized protein LOC122663826 [Telopea speciosissima]|uniref:uncharacterized protein LOC122663826 n=1 Tax=Telopea speciosissima TaxID=54955 RepID=UPI001CC490EC|nr:uncharacterized protein LOC122663826 [Telopea speciosissima]